MTNTMKTGPVLMDLFAGCGGLSLGLEHAGFRPIFVNELHPSARATYLLNRPDIDELQNSRNQSGDIREITQSSSEMEALARRLKRTFGEIDLIAGGPPCQGFSGIGHRRSFEISRNEVPGNHLFQEMANFISAVGPRGFLFENVKGLLSAKWTPEGSRGEIWADINMAFSLIEHRRGRRSLRYHIQPALIYAKNFGVPQNRPRVIIIGVREDVCNETSLQTKTSELVGRQPLKRAPDLIDLLDDLADPNWNAQSTVVYPSEPMNDLQRAFRTSRDGRSFLKKGHPLTEQEYSNHRPDIVEKFKFMIDNGGEIPTKMKTKKFAQRVLPTRWPDSGPFITATSLPDDYVHYALPRTPTVREWARLQTFPDWYSFAGRRTTGGRRRAGDPAAGIWDRDVPKYTQIGNAVPVFMAKALGDLIIPLIS